MTFELKACPKPPVRARRTRAPLRNRKPLKRTKMRCGAGSRRRNKSSFPKQRHGDFTRWLVTENDCELTGAILTEPLTTADVRVGRHWQHRCFGRLTPAHIGQHRAKGAPDFGRTIPLDEATHGVLDNQPKKFYRATKLTEAKLAHRAEGYAVKYTERGGIAA